MQLSIGLRDNVIAIAFYRPFSHAIFENYCMPSCVLIVLRANYGKELNLSLWAFPNLLIMRDHQKQAFCLYLARYQTFSSFFEAY